MLLAFCSGMAAAATWNCKNEDMEVYCDPDGCQATLEHDFTPMSVAFNDSGSLSVCAYAGCWEGDGEVLQTKDFLMIAAHGLPFWPAPNGDDERTNIALVLDLHDGVAVLKAGGFSHPVICKQRAVE